MRQCYFLLAVLVSTLISTAAASATQSLRSGGYFCGTDGSCRFQKPGDPDWLFQRFTYAMGYAECPMSISEWRSKSPNCRLIYYTSGTDMPAYTGDEYRNYNAGKKSTWIRNRLVQLGANSESAYLHFYHDTKIRDWNGTSYDTMLIRGTNSMTITAKDSISRVPNGYTHYLFMAGSTYENPARLSPNFASLKLRQAYKEYICQIFDATGDNEHWVGKTGYWDGVYFDNYSPSGMKGSGYVSGGLVVETGNSPDSLLTYGSQTYADWCWNLMQTFGRELRDTLQTADVWAVDHQKKYLAYNVGQTHKNSYLYADSSGADALNYEFGWDPVFCNNSSYYRLENLFTRDSIAVLNGVTSFWTSPPRAVYGSGTVPAREAIYNTFCFYLGARSDSTWIYMRPSSGNAYGVFLNSGFDTLAWITAMEYELGWPAQHYELAASGPAVDQVGGSYKIWQRQYPNGLVYIRPVDGFDAKWGSQSTPITISLPGSYRQLQTDGTLGSVVTELSLRGGQGAIMIPAVTGECSSPPSLPTASTPTSGTTLATTTPSLCVISSTQSNCSQPIRYHIQVSISSSFSTIARENSSIAHTAGTSCWQVTSALTPGTVYYWRCRAGNGVSWSNWSATSSFTTPNTAPSAPAAYSPANSATVTSRQPTLIVTNATDPDGTTPTYQFQVSSSSSFSAITAQNAAVTQGSGSTTSWQVSVTLNNQSTYYWRVRAYDGIAYSGWTAVRSFYVNATTTNTPPTTPTVNYPVNSATITVATPALRVNNSTDANGNTLTYQFELLDSTGVTQLALSPMVSQGTGTTSWTVSFSLTNNRRYRWRCRAYDGQAWSSYMTTAEFLVRLDSNSPPTVPVPLTPINNQTVIGQSVQLMTNNSTDAEGNALTYYFSVYSDSNLSKLVESSGSRPQITPYTSYNTVGTYIHNMPYWWNVRSSDGITTSFWSSAQKFTHLDVALDVDDIVSLVSPVPGSEEISTKPTFRISWQGDDDTVACTFEIALDERFQEMYDAGLVAGYSGRAEWIPLRPLENESTYYWRAKVASDAYSEAARFSVSSQIFISPNPFSYLDGEMTVHNLPQGSRFEVFTPAGDKVIEVDNLAGDYRWDVRNSAGEKLGSGVFLYYITFGGRKVSDKFIVVR